MLTKSEPDEIQSFLADASNMQGGHVAQIVFPANAQEVADVLAKASHGRVPVTIAGAGTGIVGGRVPFGGMVLATDRLKEIKEIVQEGCGGWATVEAGVTLADFQRAVEAEGLLYPPDPTERSCYLGGTVATNASGARTFKYGATRKFVRRLKLALATGDVLDLARGDAQAGEDGKFSLKLSSGHELKAQLPSYSMPHTRKHAAGYYVAAGMDMIDLFIGSEGTLGVITEVETTLLPKPAGVLSGIVFFKDEARLLAFVREARAASLSTRAENTFHAIDARALEYFDRNSLNLLREKFALIPEEAAGAVFFEQETTAGTEEHLMEAWLALLERHAAQVDDSWFATNESDRQKLREFRHQLPVLVNEWLTRHHQRKVSTDMAVPDEEFAAMLHFYNETLEASNLQFVIFGHIGDNHVHVNILPRDDGEAAAARSIYAKFIERAVHAGGTVSAEHGIGKIKRDYLRLLYGDAHLREMAALKRAFDPACILGRGNIFSERYL